MDGKNKHDSIKPLAMQFIGRGEVKDYLFSQISQADKAFSGDSKHYDVFKKIINKRYACVSYPTSKAFGIWAYTKMSLESAIEKFNELNKINN